MIKHLILLKNLNFDEHQRGLASVVNRFFDKTTYSSDIKNENMLYQQLAEELHKTITRKF